MSLDLKNYQRENEAAAPAYASPSASAAIALENLAAAVRKMREAYNELLSRINAADGIAHFGDRGPSVHGGITAAASAFEAAVVLRDAFADNAAEYFPLSSYHYRAALAGGRTVSKSYAEEYLSTEEGSK